MGRKKGLLNMQTTSNSDYAALLLRLASGVAFLAHAGMKAFVFGFAGTAGYFQSIGLPGPFAYLIILLEAVGAVALILGVQTRIVAAVLGLELLGVAWVGHGASGWMFANPGGGWEYPAYWAVTMFALALLGGGSLSLGQRRVAGV